MKSPPRKLGFQRGLFTLLIQQSTVECPYKTIVVNNNIESQHLLITHYGPNTEPNTLCDDHIHASQESQQCVFIPTLQGKNGGSRSLRNLPRITQWQVAELGQVQLFAQTECLSYWKHELYWKLYRKHERDAFQNE